MLGSVALYHCAALRQIEQRAIAADSGDGSVLMQRAGLQAWRCVLQHWPDAQRICVVCGPGNNGGDGYVLARHALLAGRSVQVLRLPAHAPRTALAQQQAAAFVQQGGQVVDFTGQPLQAAVCVDALFGIGLQHAPDADSADLIAAINASGAAVLALDVPSGLNADTGHAPGEVVRAAHTVEFIAAHVGHYTGMAHTVTGQLSQHDLGIDRALFAQPPVAAQLLRRPALARAFTPRARDAHKGQHGHVLCVGGEQGAGGALLLCVEAALRSGAGLVSAVTRAQHVPALLARRPECMAFALENADALADKIQRADVIAAGPGLGQTAWSQAIWQQLQALQKPLVLDADALNLLAQAPRKLHAETVLTPHPGEAARLLQSTVAKVQSNRLHSAQQLAQTFACVVLLKGAGTVIADSNGSCYVIGAGNPGMATGGMGDVLTGVIAALRAQGFSGIQAASIGALLHASAADMAAQEDGERGLLPSDILPFLRRLSNHDNKRRDVIA